MKQTAQITWHDVMMYHVGVRQLTIISAAQDTRTTYNIPTFTSNIPIANGQHPPVLSTSQYPNLSKSQHPNISTS